MVNAAFFSTGQKCTATSRAIVEDAIYDRFVAAVVERTKKLKVGDGMQAGIDIGPCVDQAQMETVLRLHRDRPQGSRRAEVRRQPADGRRAGQGLFRRAHGLRGRPKRSHHRAGRDLRAGAGGHARQGFRGCHAHRQQHSVRPFASIQTTNLSRVFEYVYRMEAGLLTVNLPSAGVEYQLPFGGTKDSSFGPKEQGPAALEFYSDYKTVYLKY